MRRRHHFGRLMTLGGLAGMLCGPQSGCGATPSAYGEAPALAAEVAAGRLPQVEARLPARPLLLQPVQGPGRYGGTWRLGSLEENDIGFLFRNVGYEPLVRWDPSWRRIAPGVAERWEVSTDARRFTFWLRDGLRWSDGHPMTSADILFWREHIAGSTNAASLVSSWLAPGGELPVVRATGDHQVEFVFSRPNGMFLQWLATPSGSSLVTTPRHALTNCFPAFNPDAEADARQIGFPSAWSRYHARWTSPFIAAYKERIPTLYAWVFTGQAKDSEGRTVAVAQRNPYYWKIDPLGRQLPYLDEVRLVVARNREDLLAMATSGELDMQDYLLRGQREFTALQEAAASGTVRLSRRIPSSSNTAAISANLNHRDPALRSFFGARPARVALSIAIDRDRMIAEIFGGRGRPFQVAPRPDSTYYHARLATQHLEHDPQAADRLLDAAGFPRNNAGRRTFGKGGEPIRFTIHVAGDVSANAAAVARRLAEDWDVLGLTVEVKSLSQAEFYRLKNDNDHDVVLWSGDGGLDPLLEPRYYVPLSHESNYGIRWAAWRQNPMRGEEPPEGILELFRLYDEVMEAADDHTQRVRFARLLDRAADEFLVIGCSLPEGDYGVVHPRLRNVPEFIYESWNYPHPAPVNPCLFYFAE